MNSVLGEYAEAIKAAYERSTHLHELATQVKALAELQLEVQELKTASFNFWNEKIFISVPVKKLAAIEPVLESLEKKFGFEFDKTEDVPSGGWRQFESSSADWLRVDADLIADGDECRRVVVGYNSLPIYKFECGEVQT